jgi:hypothetical protein
MVSGCHMRLLLFVTLVALPWWSVAAGAEVKPKAEAEPKVSAKIQAEQAKQARAAMAEFTAAVDAAGREAAIAKIIGSGATTAAIISSVLDNQVAIEEGKYTKLIEPAIRSAYLKKLAALSDADLNHVIRTKNLWKPYIQHGGEDPKFPEVYLKPILKMKDILLPKLSDLDDPAVVAARARLLEFADYQTRVRNILGINPDPTVGKLSPTNIEYAHLDKPHAFADRLHHFERTLILINTVASPGAREVLLLNDQSAREIDVEEAEFVMASNEVRMLAGSIAWRADPLGCAVERDHSTDRKEGRAEAHTSTVPGKHAFTDRNKRMGAIWYGSEGAGGGNHGPEFLFSMSYSGSGHGGPLYSLGCNVVGVGRRGDVYTSQYAMDTKLSHPCPVTDQEVWMPPGISARDLREAAVQEAFTAMKTESYAQTNKMLGLAKAPTTADAIAVRFFNEEIAVRSRQAVARIQAIDSTGDHFSTKVALNECLAKFKGIPIFDDGVAELTERLGSKELRQEILTGEAYYRFYYMAKDLPKEKFESSRRDLVKNLDAFARKHKDSTYGKAAADAVIRLAAPESDAGALLAFFTDRK